MKNCLILGAVLLAARLNAQESPEPSPSAAVQACGGLALGGYCTLTLDGHVVSGACRSGSDREAPVCVADNARPPPGPPREAIEACNRLELNAGCRFTVRGTETQGSCQKLDGAVVPICVEGAT